MCVSATLQLQQSGRGCPILATIKLHLSCAISFVCVCTQQQQQESCHFKWTNVKARTFNFPISAHARKNAKGHEIFGWLSNSEGGGGEHVVSTHCHRSAPGPAHISLAAWTLAWTRDLAPARPVLSTGHLHHWHTLHISRRSYLLHLDLGWLLLHEDEEFM